jgi:hypothetical protein
MHGPDADSVQTFNDNYPGGFKKFERHWRSWIPRARKSRALRALKNKTKKPDQKTTADKN